MTAVSVLSPFNCLQYGAIHVGRASTPVDMGLRPTNSDENHVGQAPSLRRPPRPPFPVCNNFHWVFDRARGLQDPLSNSIVNS
jgi:hypothetical protein